MFLRPEQPQPVGIAHHSQRGKGHRGAGNDRIEEQTEERVQHAGGNRNTGHVVDECAEQILPDVPDGRLFLS